MALAQAIEQAGAIELRHQIAGEPADGAELAGAGIARARPALVAVGIADDADAVTGLERVLYQPFEGAPGGMHLDRALEAAVMGEIDVGVAAAAMGEADDVEFLVARESFEQLAGGRQSVARSDMVLDQRMRRAADDAAFVGEKDVAVAAERGIAGPFVAGQSDETARLVECLGQPVELVPRIQPVIWKSLP